MVGGIPVGSSHPEARDEGDEAGNKDSASPPNIFIERRVGPAANKRGTQIWRAVEKALHPFIRDVEFLEVVQLGRRQPLTVQELEDIDSPEPR